MKSFIPLSFRLSPHALRLTLSLLSLAPLFLSTPVVVLAQWEPDVRLTFDDSLSGTSWNNARIIATSDDTVHVVWFDNRDGNREIYYKRSTDGGTLWGQDSRLTADSDSSQNPSLAVSGQNLHLVWQDHRDGNWKIYYKRSADGGATWGADTRLTLDTMESGTPSLAVLDTIVHVVWSNRWRIGGTDSSEIFYKRSTNNGETWTQDTVLTRDPIDTLTGHFLPSISLSDSFVHLVYLVGDISMNLSYKRSTNTGLTWSAATLLAGGFYYPPPGYSYGDNRTPSVFALGANVHVVWSYQAGNRYGFMGRVFHSFSRDNGLSWSNRSTLAGADYRIFRTPSVYASGFNVHAVWCDDRLRYLGTSEIYYRNSLDGGASWEPDVQLTNDSLNSINPFIAVQGTKVHVVWADNREGNYEIYYKRNLTGNGVEESGGSRQKSVGSIKATPNPFSSFARVLGHETERFALYDISGRLVGNYRGDRIGEGLAAGVYFLRTEGKAAKPLRIVKVK